MKTIRPYTPVSISLWIIHRPHFPPVPWSASMNKGTPNPKTYIVLSNISAATTAPDITKVRAKDSKPLASFP
uniref:Uncharacterized protein n=1 Tax=Arundo donax TaxID=35708 RepID=A0A0A9DQ05_ARUDO